MAGDFSPYERRHPRRVDRTHQLTFGRVVKVDPQQRLCDVRTFGSHLGMLDDQYLSNCQWMAQAFHVDGDEDTVVPRTGAYVIVAIIDGEGFVLGAFRPLPKRGKAIGDTDPQTMREGDRFIRTKGGNRVLIKSNGLIEVYSKETLKRVYFPTTSEIRDFCRNYRLSAEGGLVFWQSTNEGTLWRGEFRADPTKATGVVVDEKGTVGGGIMARRQIGPAPGAPPFTVPVPTYFESIDLTGKVKRTMGLPGAGIEMTFSPDGSITIKTPTCATEVAPTGAVSFKQTVGNEIALSAAGDLSFKNLASSLGLDAKGNLAFKNPIVDVTADNQGNIKSTNSSTTFTQDPKGFITLDAAQSKLRLGQGKIEFGGPLGGLVDAFLQHLNSLKDVCTALITVNHIGNLGYNTSPPVDPTPYSQAVVTAIKLINIVKATKGDLS